MMSKGSGPREPDTGASRRHPGSATGVPTELVGEWSQGSMATDVFGPIVSAPATAAAFLYRFAADGSYEFAASMESAGTAVHSYEHGTVDVSGDRLTIRPAEKRVRQPDGTTTMHAPREREYRWRVERDPLGSVRLVVTLPDGEEDVFVRR